MWKIEDKQKNAPIIKESLESLKGKIDGLIDIEVGINTNASDAACDVVLYSLFESQEALDAYQVNPLHVEAAVCVKNAAKQRCVVDYEQ